MEKRALIAKTGSVLLWVLIVLMTVQFTLASIPKLIMSEREVRHFDTWGYGTGFMVLVGVIELMGGLALLLPQTATYGACALIAIMIGAAYTHITSGIGSPATALVNILLLLVILWRRAPEFVTKRLTRRPANS